MSSIPSKPDGATPSSGADHPAAPLEQLLAQRQETLKRIIDKQINPYPYHFERSHTFKAVHEKFDALPEGQDGAETIKIAGRVMTVRDMGKSCFANLSDGPDRLQIYVKKDVVGEEPYKLFQKDTDIGDFIGVEGVMFRTRTKELTLRVTHFTLLAKSLRPLPEKWHGLKDTETRYRQRELDLLSNPDVQKLFRQRSHMILSLRQTLTREGFLEVETPLLQAQAGGAAARPFKTFHFI